MPTQSIDLSAVKEATFNGSAVEQINLNGTEIWTPPAIRWGVLRGGVGTHPTHNVQGAYIGPAYTYPANYYPVEDGGMFNMNYGHTAVIAPGMKDGVAYLGWITASSMEGSTIYNLQNITNPPSTWVATSGDNLYFRTWASDWVTTWLYTTSTFTPFATISKADGIQPLGSASSGTTQVIDSVCNSNNGPYGACDGWEDISRTYAFAITPTSYSITTGDSTQTWSFNMSTGILNNIFKYLD